MAKIDSISFGSIVVDGKKYRRDVFLFPDGSVKQRKGGFLIFGSHNIKREEIEELSRAGTEMCVIGIGTNSQAKLSKEANSFAEQTKLDLHICPLVRRPRNSINCWERVGKQQRLSTLPAKS